MLSLLVAFLLAAPPVQTTDPAGPWRQLIRFEATADRPDGVSLWVTDAAVLPPDGPRRHDQPTAQELWVVHGATVGGQAYVVKTNRYGCDDSTIHTDHVAAFARDGRLLAESGQSGEPGYPQSHSAEAEAFDAVCSGSRIAARGAVVATVAEAVAQAGPERDITPEAVVQLDFDYDGQKDFARIGMVPHSMRHDVEFVLAKQANRPVNVITADQPATGPLVQRLIRPLERDRYLIACRMEEGHDITPCEPDYPLVQRGVEVVTPGQPTILVWLEEGEARVARLP